MGSACGRVTFDLARDHRHAIGLDRSARFVGVANRILNEGVVRYRLIDEGELEETVELPIDVPENSSFVVGDAGALPFSDGMFQTVTALNLVDRVPDPGRALDELGRVVKPGGWLIISSPFTWMPDVTPRENWLGGKTIEGVRVHGAQGIQQRLGDRFDLELEQPVPFYIPHHARSGQLAVTIVQRYRSNK